MPVHAACRLDQLVDGRGWPVVVSGRYLAVFLVEGRVHVIDNQCLHVGSPLDGGAVEGHDVLCPWHGWRYDLRTGAHRTGFGDRPGLRVHRAWVEDGVVKVDLAD